MIILRFALMIDLCFFYSTKMVIVFILMLSSATLKAQRNENDKFFDLMTAIGEDFGGEFNDAEKALELDLNGANAFLERLHRFATREIIRKNENGEFECKEPKKADFKMAIQTILGENMRNLIKAFLEKSSGTQLDTIKTSFGKKLYKKVENLLKTITVPKQSESVKLSGDHLYTIQTIFDDNSFKKVEDLLKELSVKLSKEQLFNLLYSLATRLEALVHGKNSDGTLKEKQENWKEKIQTFLAVPKCFILPESELKIFDYWIKIIKMKTQKSQKPVYGVAIYKKKNYARGKENYKILKQLNDQKFSIYESINLLREAFTLGYIFGIPKGILPHIFNNLFIEILLVFLFNWERIEYWHKHKKCVFAMFFQNISENLMKMMRDKGIDPKLHLELIDFKIQKDVQKDVEETCKKFENEEAKIRFLNNVHFELAINFQFNQRKDVYGRAGALLLYWGMNTCHLTEQSYLKKNFKIKKFILKTNRESISIIEALIEKEFNLGALFDQIKTLVEVAIPEEEANLEKAKKEINKKQLENDIKFLNKNPKSIAEEKYQKVVAIICTIKQHGEKVKMLASKIKNIEIKTKMIELSSKIQNNEMEYFGPELLKQTKEFCKIKQIEMDEIGSREYIILEDLQFEFNKIWKSSKGVWEGIEEYYLSIPLMQLTEQAPPLAKKITKMIENVRQLYAHKMDESNVGGE